MLKKRFLKLHALQESLVKQKILTICILKVEIIINTCSQVNSSLIWLQELEENIYKHVSTDDKYFTSFTSALLKQKTLYASWQWKLSEKYVYDGSP